MWNLEICEIIWPGQKLLPLGYIGYPATLDSNN
jgi:hypothetical protein